jgi:hypothetical protein
MSTATSSTPRDLEAHFKLEFNNMTSFISRYWKKLNGKERKEIGGI